MYVYIYTMYIYIYTYIFSWVCSRMYFYIRTCKWIESRALRYEKLKKEPYSFSWPPCLNKIYPNFIGLFVRKEAYVFLYAHLQMNRVAAKSTWQNALQKCIWFKVRGSSRFAKDAIVSPRIAEDLSWSLESSLWKELL